MLLNLVGGCIKRYVDPTVSQTRRERPGRRGGNATKTIRCEIQGNNATLRQQIPSIDWHARPQFF
jgi:hypothetical protein